jgi:hypothetical protein
MIPPATFQLPDFLPARVKSVAVLTVRLPAIASASMAMTVSRNVTTKPAETKVVSDVPPLLDNVASLSLVRLV